MSEVTARLGTGRFAADFVVTATAAHLWWYLPGPDGRYNGGTASLNVNAMQSFIRAVDEAWNRLERLRTQAQSSGVTLTQEPVIEKWLFCVTAGGPGSGFIPFYAERYANRLRVGTVADLDALTSTVQKALVEWPRLTTIAIECT